MNSIYTSPAGTDLPDHTQLPETDGSMVENFQEFPLGLLLSDSLAPVLKVLHPDNHYALGLDSGIYWRYVAEEPLRGCKSPDWYYVPGVPPMPPGTYRRSYVLWQERVSPQIVLEFVSGDGSEEHDQTPETGKFWVYEQAIRATYYGIFDSERDSLEMYQLVNGRYQRMTPNAHGRYFLPPLGVELGLWYAQFATMTLPWLRWWDAQGEMLLTGHEMVELERQAKEQAERQADVERRGKVKAEQQADAERKAKEEAERQADAERKAKEEAERQADAERRGKETAERQADAERRAKETAAREAAEERQAKEGAEQWAAEERRQKEQARRDAAEAAQRAERLAEKLRALGIDPEA